MVARSFTAFFPFCGLGAGARGFLDAEVRLFGERSRFRSVGGVDIDPEACEDFERLTGSPALRADMHDLGIEDLRSFVGDVSPDVVFSSPPCKGFSGLISSKALKSEKYERLNRLALRWVELVIEAWPDPPRLIVMENVPRITSRGRHLLAAIRLALGRAGYLIDERTHDCGEIGGLAQHRRRYLLVARHPRRCPPVLYQPPKRRVLGCGEVLGQLPIPGSPGAARWGRLHDLPKISWLNWVRLALIPAGGDWRDLPGVLGEGQPRREVHKRHEVVSWSSPSSTVAGPGANGVGVVADPRPAVEWRGGTMGVRSWDASSGTVTGRANISTGTFAVADPRLNKSAYCHAYRVLRWDEASFTVAGKSSCGCGAYQVADPRVDDVAGRRIAFDELIGAWDGDPRKPPPFTPVVIGPDGCWHRPMTTLELAALQGLPAELDGRPLELTGRATTRWRERIGNAVPVQSAEAVGRQMLIALTEAAMGTMRLGQTPTWVSPRRVAMGDCGELGF
jgi:site-specific DNA-cytosine methylase